MNAYPNGCAKCGNTNEWAGYNHGFCDGCAKSILEASAKRLQRKGKAPSAAPTVNKKLAQDLAACETAIAALATCEQRLGLTGPEWREAIETATKSPEGTPVRNPFLGAAHKNMDWEPFRTGR
jgi:hypothetical protein